MTGPRIPGRRLWPVGGTFWLDVVVGVSAALAALIAHRTADLSTLDPRLLPPSLLSSAVTVIGALGLVLRRVRPIVGFAILGAATTVVSLTDHYVAVLPLLLLLSLYSVAAHSSRRASVVTLAVLISTFVALVLIGVPDLPPSAVVQSSALMVAAWAIGVAVRSGRKSEAERLRAAEQDARAAREEAARATAEERLRIARELHDVVAHSMSMIAVQAGVGAHVIKTDPLAAEHALAVIAETSREALAQTRAMLGMLRSDDDQPLQQAMPQLEDVDELVDRVRALGLQVELTREVSVRVDEPTSRAAYRVVQESLTNVIKHSAAHRVKITIHGDAEVLLIKVADDGRGGPPATGGHGLGGLRERVRLLNGQFSAATQPEGGFAVEARFPLSTKELVP
jgi:signal transduction histidine kinase